MGIRLQKNKIDNENNKKTVCLNKRAIEYSVPIREYIANKPIKDNNKGKINNCISMARIKPLPTSMILSNISFFII